MIDRPADYNIYARNVKSATIDQIEYANQCQLIDTSRLTQNISYLEKC